MHAHLSASVAGEPNILHKIVRAIGLFWALSPDVKLLAAFSLVAVGIISVILTWTIVDLRSWAMHDRAILEPVPDQKIQVRIDRLSKKSYSQLIGTILPSALVAISSLGFAGDWILMIAPTVGA